MKKIDWKSVGNVIGEVGKIVLSGVGLYTLAMFSGNIDTTSNTKSAVGTYNSAIEAIMDSDLYSHQKTEAVAILSRDEDTEYYRAIINIVESDIYCHEKMKLIKKLSEG